MDDPARRDDGLCAVCLAPIPTGRAHVRAHMVTEPFCSVECCNVYHGLLDVLPAKRKSTPGKAYVGFDK